MSSVSSGNGVDRPLTEFSDDRFDRVMFAKKIFHILDSAPKDIHLRAGISGRWGTGKTTVLNFLMNLCKGGGHPAVLFNPWRFRTPEQARKGLAMSIEEGLTHWKSGTPSKPVKKSSSKKTSAQKGSLKELGKSFSKLITGASDGLIEQEKKTAEELIARGLGDNRFYIFVDDLEKAQPEVLYDLLMLLDQALDLPNVIIVAAFDTKETEKLIERKTGIGNGKNFIAKLFHHSFDLPSPIEYEWHDFLESELKFLDKNIKKDVLDSIFNYLPRNPRSFKQFLRYLHGLHKSFLTRFETDELKWDVVYISQLIKFEFPDEFDKISQNKDLIKKLHGSDLKDAMRKAKTGNLEDESETPKWLKFVMPVIKDLDSHQKERVTRLISILRAAGMMIPENDFQKYFRLIEDPGLFTWKEYRDLKKSLADLKPGERFDHLKSFFKEKENAKEIAIAREFLKMLFEDRGLQLSYLSVDQEQKQNEETLSDIKFITSICNLVLDIDRVFDGWDPVFNEDVFIDWCSHLEKWRKSKQPSSSSLRSEEKILAVKFSEKLKGNISSYLVKMKEAFLVPAQKLSQNSSPPNEEIVRVLERRLLDELVNRFSLNNGIYELWDPKFRPERELLFKKDSIFHSEAVYKRLRGFSDTDDTNTRVWKNYFEYTQMLFYAATDGLDWADPKEAQEILKNKNFLNFFREAGASEETVQKTIRNLEKDRENAIEILGKPNVLPVPVWWDEMVQSN